MSEAGLYMKAGWKEPLMFYRFKCKVHGRVVNYMQGYKQVLHCPVCDEVEFKEEMKKLEAGSK